MPPLPSQVDAVVELVHRIAGYPLAFVVAPVAIATFAGQPGTGGRARRTPRG